MVDVFLFFFLYRDIVVLYRDLSGVSFYKRGYCDVMYKVSLNEGIVVVVLIFVGWNQVIFGFGDVNKNVVG